MIGTTRSRVSFFMNRFRKLGFIEYNGRIQVSQVIARCYFARLNDLRHAPISVSPGLLPPGESELGCSQGGKREQF